MRRTVTNQRRRILADDRWLVMKKKIALYIIRGHEISLKINMVLESSVHLHKLPDTIVFTV